MTTKKKPEPTGICFCGCEGETKQGAFFISGHDKAAESAVIALEYGTVADFVVAHGYGPGGKNARTEQAKVKIMSLSALIVKKDKTKK